MRSHRTSPLLLALLCLALASSGLPALAAEPAAPLAPDGSTIFSDALTRWANVIEPTADQPAKTFTAKVTVTKADGLMPQALGAVADVAFQGPDRVRLSVKVGDETFGAGRDGREIWLYRPARKFGVIGAPDVPRFRADPDSVVDTRLPPFELPISKWQLKTLPWIVQADLQAEEEIDGVRCHVVRLIPKEAAAETFGVRGVTATLWVRQDNGLPARITATDGRRFDVQLDVADAKLVRPFKPAQWELEGAPGDKIERVALSHLLKFFDTVPDLMNNHVEPLGPATGERRLIATEGRGRLEEIDGTLVLFMKGTPREMGHQHGTLMKRQVRDLVKRVLYGVGVGSSFEKGSWFFGDIEGAVARVQPYVDRKYLDEMDALAAAAGVHPQESRLANFFPEMFHCTGFSLFGKATVGGRMYHGRVLDYMRGVGLEQNAVVMVYQPTDGRYAWVNVGYAGFTGTVTAMNEKGISIGEMGGGGYGNWDGKPMAQLLREVMERSSTLDQAVEIMRKGPRTCEYYYVISDAKNKSAVGIASTHDKFEVIRPGESHPRLEHAIEDAVLMSADDRYQELARRVKAGYGKFDADSARALMTRPVCMTSNIQSVLFAPETLDFWVANADSTNVASHARYTKYNLRELLDSEPPAPPPQAQQPGWRKAVSKILQANPLGS